MEKNECEVWLKILSRTSRGWLVSDELDSDHTVFVAKWQARIDRPTGRERDEYVFIMKTYWAQTLGIF